MTPPVAEAQHARWRLAPPLHANPGHRGPGGSGRAQRQGSASWRSCDPTRERPPSFSHLSMLSSMKRVSCIAAGADIGSSPHSGREHTPTPRVALTRRRTGSESARDEWLWRTEMQACPHRRVASPRPWWTHDYSCCLRPPDPGPRARPLRRGRRPVRERSARHCIGPRWHHSSRVRSGRPARRGARRACAATSRATAPSTCARVS